MISKNTANIFLNVAKGDNVDFFFKAADEVRGLLKNQPSQEQILEKWSKLSSENIINLVRSISNTETLDLILVKEKRKTVLRAIATNKNLSHVSRMYLYQMSYITDDHELKNTVLQNMDAKSLIELVLEDPELSKTRNNYLTLEKLAETNSEILAEKFFKATGLDYLQTFATYNMPLANKIAKLVNFQQSNESVNIRYSRKGNQVANLGVSDYQEFLSNFPSTDSKNYVLGLVGEDLELLAKIDKNLLTEYFKQRSDFTLNDVIIAEKYNLTAELAKVVYSTDSAEAAERLLSLEKPINCKMIIINHPDRTKAIEWFLKHYEIFKDSSKSSSKLTQFADEFSSELGLDKYWEIYRNNCEQNISGNVLESLNKKGYSYEKIIEKMPLTFISKIRNIPTGFNFDALYARIDEIIDQKNKIIFLETIIDNIVPRYGEEDSKYSHLVLKIITELYNAGAKDNILTLLHRRNISSQATELIYQIIRQDPEMLEESIKAFSYRDTESLKGLIDIIAPKKGWGSMLRSSEITESVYDFLASQLGDDKAKWEMAFTVFDDWKGTLPELVHMCENI